MDKKIVLLLNNMPEKDRYLRGLRAWVGFKQTGINYTRPERRYGVSTNNFFNNIRWAKKGIFSFLKIFKEMASNAELSIVGNTKDFKANNKKINFLGFEHNVSAMIKNYDNHNITILPSFTEAHPKVVDESLVRGRPVIVFEEIHHIIQNRYGIFVSKRSAKSLSETIEFIMNNYSSIQENMKRNKLPTKQEFISQITQILN